MLAGTAGYASARNDKGLWRDRGRPDGNRPARHGQESASMQARSELASHGVAIVTAPFDGPFGRTFAFADPDGYIVTVHS